MRLYLIILTCLVNLLSATAVHAGDTIGRGAPPAWVKAAPVVDQPAPAANGDAFRIEVFDQQYYFDGAGSHVYVRSRAAVLTPQALASFGTVALPWNPAAQDVTVHAVDIWRGDQRIDALEGRDFAILRRETNLEAAVVDGVLTATLQLDDLRVGDRLEFAYSVKTHIPLMGSHAEFLASGAVPASVDQYFFRASWPTSINMQIQATDDWPRPQVRRRGDRSEIEVALTGVEPVLVPADAPLRFHYVKVLEGTDYAAWSDVSALFVPLYEQASVLADDSPLHAEIERIRTTHSSQADQVLAALRLVQDEVRYLALAMGEGGLLPATADDTWNRRLGDCKGKTSLLLALLKGLGVEAHPVLASTVNDALDQRLPAMSAFDHVFVQAVVDGQIVWLDGTRVGDRSLTALPPLAYGWVLPVKAGATLVRLPSDPPSEYLREVLIELDLSNGIYSAGPVTGEVLMRGDTAAMMQVQFSVASPAQRDAYMRTMWPGLIDDLTITTVASAYDEARNELRLTMTGEATLDWASRGGRRAEAPLSRISWSSGDRRPEGPFRDLPFITNYPAFSRFRTTVILPDGGEGFVVNADDIDQEAAAYRHRRHVTRDGARVVMERDTVALRPEMTEAERVAAKEPLERLSNQRVEIVAPRGYETTATDLDQLESEGPQTATALVNRALALNGNNRPEEAIAALDRAIAIDPNHANAYANRGIVRFWSGDAEGAEADFARALEISPTERVAMNGRGLLALRQKRHLDAVVEFTLSLRAQPDDTAILGFRAQAYGGMREWDKALADLRRVQELRPGIPETGLMEVSVLVAAERLEEARTVVAALAERHQDDVTVLQVQAEVLELLEDYAGAEAVLDAALTIESDHPLILISRAETRFRQGDLDGGRADLAVVRPIAGESAGLLNNLCWTQAITGVDLDQALTDCDAALALAPTEAGIIDSRALVLLSLGRAAEALEVYERALVLAPELPASLYGRGLARRALGDEAAARADMAAAVRLAPGVEKPFRTYEAGHR